MHRLIESITGAQRDGKAVGHFNVADLVLLKAVVGAAHELNVPVIVGASEGEREFVGTRQIAAMVKGVSGDLEAPVFLNADWSIPRFWWKRRSAILDVRILVQRVARTPRQAAQREFARRRVAVRDKIPQLGSACDFRSGIRGGERYALAD